MGSENYQVIHGQLLLIAVKQRLDRRNSGLGTILKTISILDFNHSPPQEMGQHTCRTCLRKLKKNARGNCLWHQFVVCPSTSKPQACRCHDECKTLRSRCSQFSTCLNWSSVTGSRKTIFVCCYGQVRVNIIDFKVSRRPSFCKFTPCPSEARGRGSKG